MSVMPKLTQRWWSVFILPLFFVSLGCIFLPYAGLQNDEVLFATPDYHQPSSSLFTIPVGRYHVPVMQLSYLGALKTWLYAPLLFRIRPSYLLIRLPALLLGAMTTGMLFWFLRKIHGPRAAWAGGVLLVTDTMFLLTTCFDWGPVVLQHFLMMAGLVLLVQFAASGNRSALFWGFVALGLGMWDKALFSWMLSGLLVATVLVFSRELWSRLTGANLARAAAGFCLGALPLLVYNASSGMATFRSNTSFTLSEMPLKIKVLRTTWDGSALLAYFAYSSYSSTPGQPREPDDAVERVSAGLHNWFGERGRNALDAGTIAAILFFIPLLWRRRARRILLFCLIAAGVAWVQMAVTRNAGGSAHHVVLLYPLPQCFLAVAFAEASELALLRRWNLGAWLLGAVVFLLAGANLLLTNQYLYQFARYGAAGTWSTAIFRLSDETKRFQGVELVVDDWGILNPLVVLHRGRLPLVYVESSFLEPGENEKQQAWEQGLLASDIWIGHTKEFREFPATAEKIETSAAALGLHKQIVELVADRNNRPVYEIFRFVRGPS